MKYLADSRAEAEEKVENDWNNQQYVLDKKHFVGAEFACERDGKRKNKSAC